MKALLTYSSVIAFTFISINTVMAAPLIYHGNNANITPTALPYNLSTIEARAALTRPKQKVEPTPTQTDAEIVRRSVLSSLSSTISERLTGANSGNGRVNFGDGSYADYTTAGGTRTIVTHNLDGTTTTISFAL